MQFIIAIKTPRGWISKGGSRHWGSSSRSKCVRAICRLSTPSDSHSVSLQPTQKIHTMMKGC